MFPRWVQAENSRTNSEEFAEKAPRAVGLRAVVFLAARLKPCPDEGHNVRAGEAARKVSAAGSGLFMAHLKVRPTKIRVRGVPPFRKRRDGAP